MKYKSAYRYLLMVICASLTGCGGSYNRVEPLGGGYQETAHIHYSSSEPEGSQTSFQYQTPNGRQVTIWPSVSSGPIIKDDMAVFVGDTNSERPKFGERWPMEGRLFAVKAPEIPLDITGEVLWRWAKESGGGFKKTFENASIVYLAETNNLVGFHFAVWPNSSVHVRLDWHEIADIMREVKEKGVVHKDLRWGTSYIEKEFKPEVQK